MPTMIRPIKIAKIGIIGTRRYGSDNLPNPGITFFLSLMERSDGELRRVRKRHTIPISLLQIAENYICQMPEGGVEPDLSDGEKLEDLPKTDDLATIYIAPNGRVNILHMMISSRHMTQVMDLLNSIAKKANQAQPSQTSSPT